MADEKVFSASAVYADLMHEIKARMDSIAEIHRGLSADPSVIDGFIKAEFCYLQIRYICELIALGVAAAHEPVGLSKDILKSWNADRTLGYLAQINEHCFPKPIVLRSQDGAHQFEIRENCALEIKDVKKIYSECGEILHRGTLKNILAERQRLYDLRKLNEWARAIGSLLKHHIIMILSEGTVLLVRMGGPGEGVQVALAKAEGEAIYVPDQPPHADGDI